MKKLFISHLFLNLYLLAMIQPALPIVEYILNYDYIVSELCENKDKPILTCNGKCYLKQQLTENNITVGHNEQTPKIPAIDLSSYPVFILFKSSISKLYSTINSRNNPVHRPKETFQDIILSIFHPPQL